MHRNLELEASNASLQKRIADLLRDIDEQAKSFRGELAKKDAEILGKDEEINQLIQDYKELQDIKVGLDLEIKAYNKLLSGEETRLGKRLISTMND